MSDLISRQDAITKFNKYCTSESIDKNGIKRGEIHTAMTYEGIIKIIEALPSAEPEQKHGKWLEKEVFDNADYEIPEWQSEKCSVCGKYHTTPYLYNFSTYKYCPNCGAEMTRGEDGKA